MAKSIVSALLGKAISEGHIKSLDQPINTIPGEAFIYKKRCNAAFGNGNGECIGPETKPLLKQELLTRTGGRKRSHLAS